MQRRQWRDIEPFNDAEPTSPIYKPSTSNLAQRHTRLLQSEESGGHAPTEVGGRVEDTDQDLENEEGDIEFIIMNLYSKMKGLESKYIDLANYYKQELVKTTRPDTQQ